MAGVAAAVVAATDSSRPGEPGGRRGRAGIIFLTVFIDMVGFGIAIPVLPLYAETFGAPPATIGLLVGIYSLAQFFCAPFLGRLSDRFGRRPVLLASVIGTAFGFYLMGWAHSLALLFAARVIDGISGGNIGTAQAYLADITPPEKRARAMGFIGAAFGLGFIFGPMIGGLMSSFSLAAPFYFAGGLATANALLIAMFLPESLPPERRGEPEAAAEPAADGSGGTGGRFYRAIVGTYFLAIAGFSVMTTLYALFASHRLGFDARQTGWLLAFVGVIGVIVQGGLIGRLAKRFGELPLAAAGSVVLAGSFAVLPFAGSLAALLAVSAAMAVGNSIMTPSINALASRSRGERVQGRGLGYLQSAGSLGRAVGPVLAGGLLASDVARGIEPYARTPFWAAAVLLAGAFCALCWSGRFAPGRG
jgi:multidrug resistance protein